jgi:hypothetical protein
VSKFTNDERSTIQNIVANLTIKRTPDPMIIKHIFNQTGKSITRKTLWNIRQRLKKESYDWYSKLREGEYEYLHEFKERINKIVDLQRQHHEIISKNQHKPSIVQASLVALHKLNVTLSNYFDIVPYLRTTGVRQSQKEIERERQQEAHSRGQIRISPAGHHTRMPLVENCRCILNGVHTDTVRHIECRSCLHIWCPNALGGQDWCPNPECVHGIKGNEFKPYDENYDWVKCNCERWFKTEDILQSHLAAYPHSINNE